MSPHTNALVNNPVYSWVHQGALEWDDFFSLSLVSKMNIFVTSPQEKPCNNDGWENHDDLIYPESPQTKMCAKNTSSHRQQVYSHCMP